MDAIKIMIAALTKNADYRDINTLKHLFGVFRSAFDDARVLTTAHAWSWLYLALNKRTETKFLLLQC